VLPASHVPAHGYDEVVGVVQDLLDLALRRVRADGDDERGNAGGLHAPQCSQRRARTRRKGGRAKYSRRCLEGENRRFLAVGIDSEAEFGSFPGLVTIFDQKIRAPAGISFLRS